MNKRLTLFRKLSFILLGLIFISEQISILFRFAKNYTNLDQTLLWYAAKEFIHGRLHEPNFYGQKYNTIYESVPGELLHHLFNLPLSLTIPLSSIILVTLIWLLLALVAYRSNRPNLALLALALPSLLRVQYLVLFDAPRGILAGDLMAVIAIALAFWLFKDNLLRVASLILVGGLAIAWDFDTVLIVIPALLFILCNSWRQLLAKPKRLALLVVAAIPPAAWLVFDLIWYRRHPYELTNASVSIKPVWWIFVQDLHHFSSYFAYFAPGIIPVAFFGAALVCITIAVTLVFSIKIRSIPLFASSFSLTLLTLYGLSLVRSLNTVNQSPGLFLSASRLFIIMPIGLFLIIFLAALAYKDREPMLSRKFKTKSITKYLSLPLVVIVIISFVLATANFHNIVNRAVSQNLSTGILDETSMLSICPVAEQDYVSSGAQLLATTNPVIAYGCGAEYNVLNTFDTPADRRGWIIKYNFDKPSERILLIGGSCNEASTVHVECQTLNGGLLFVQTAPKPAAYTLSKLGFPVSH